MVQLIMAIKRQSAIEEECNIQPIECASDRRQPQTVTPIATSIVDNATTTLSGADILVPPYDLHIELTN